MLTEEQKKVRKRQYDKQYYQANKERKSLYDKQYYQANKERKSLRNKQYHQANKERIAEHKKQYHQTNKERIAERFKQYREANKERIAERFKQYREANKERLAERFKQYREANKEHLNEYNNQYRRKRKATDPLFKLKLYYRIRLCSFRKLKTGKRTMDLLGCSLEQFQLYIEQQFLEGMSWNNHGKDGWVIDHIIPLALAKTPEDFAVYAHYTNLQPLWYKENSEKRDTITDTYINRWVNAFLFGYHGFIPEPKYYLYTLPTSDQMQSLALGDQSPKAHTKEQTLCLNIL